MNSNQTRNMDPHLVTQKNELRLVKMVKLTTGMLIQCLNELVVADIILVTSWSI